MATPLSEEIHRPAAAAARSKRVYHEDSWTPAAKRRKLSTTPLPLRRSSRIPASRKNTVMHLQLYICHALVYVLYVCNTVTLYIAERTGQDRTGACVKWIFLVSSSLEWSTQRSCFVGLFYYCHFNNCFLLWALCFLFIFEGVRPDMWWWSWPSNTTRHRTHKWWSCNCLDDWMTQFIEEQLDILTKRLFCYHGHILNVARMTENEWEF